LDLYYDVKDPVCDIIMACAEEWAQRQAGGVQVDAVDREQSKVSLSGMRRSRH